MYIYIYSYIYIHIDVRIHIYIYNPVILITPQLLEFIKGHKLWKNPASQPVLPKLPG